jgi:soluble lytic murein transglycosylase-like protein
MFKSKLLKKAEVAPPVNPPAEIRQLKKMDPDDWHQHLGLGSLERIHGLKPEVLKHIIELESKGDPWAKSPAGAKGLFGIMPPPQSGFKGNPHDPVESARFVAQYLTVLLKRFGDYEKALAAYNWGWGNVVRKGLERAPKETRDYLEHFKRQGIINPKEEWDLLTRRK